MNRREYLRALGAVGAARAFPHFGVVPGGVARPATRVTPAARRATGDLQARLEEAIAKHKVPGASAALFKDGTMETAATGLTNVVSGVPMTAETVMHIGSITKVFNTTLMMQLVDQGLVRLDAPLKSYLPDFRVADRDATERITVKMLLNHTSGIDGELTPEAGHDWERIEDAIPRIAAFGQIHAPGTDLSYCNAAFVLAGYLAQRLTGRSWYDLVKERIFKPLEMDHAIVVPEDALLFRASVGHFLNPSDGKLSRTSFVFLPLSYAPAGATAMMSATDLVTFARAHMNDGLGPNGHRLLTQPSAQLMRVKTASYKGAGFADFGLGWMLMPNGVVTHGGGGPGILSAVYAHPASKTAVAVLTNAAHGGAVINDIVAPVLEPLGVKPTGAAAIELAKQATDTPVDPAPYVGGYESVATAARVLPHGNGIAFASRSKFRVYDTTNLTESAPVPLRPIGDGHFALSPTAVVRFVNPDARGKMGHLATGGRLLRRVP